jgi:hypothetical protein
VKRDAVPFKKPPKKVAVIDTETEEKPSVDEIPTASNETSGEDLLSTFGHLSAEDPNETPELGDHIAVNQIAFDLVDEYQQICVNLYDPSEDFEYDAFDCSGRDINSINRDAVCVECGSRDHASHDCPSLFPISWAGHETDEGFKCSKQRDALGLGT